MKQLVRRVLIGLAVVLTLLGGGAYTMLRASLLPPEINMSSTHVDHSTMTMPMPESNSPPAAATPMAQLVDPPSSAPLKAFTLTAQTATIDLGLGEKVEAWTFNGTAPGPELRVQQGDQVVVKLINKDIAAGVTIHWHGVAVPNAMDGVAGVTQDAVKPGETFTYRFIAKDAGTYWYHSHQESHLEVLRGLYGLLIVEPRDAPLHYDRDYTLDLHEWKPAADCFGQCAKTLLVNGSAHAVSLDARQGELVRLRLLNSGEDVHWPALLGAPAQVIALDGHDINAPVPLNTTRFLIAPAQRYDLSFRMPESGTVEIIDADENAIPSGQHPVVSAGSDAVPNAAPYPADAPLFDFARYGKPLPDALTSTTQFDAHYDIDLNNRLGALDGQFFMLFTINGKTFPDTPMIAVQPGQLVKIHIHNSSGDLHPMHLHGHAFTVLMRNGQPLTGSPIVLDTLAVGPNESYDIAFRADNPGLWMLHCHILRHARQGMDMMVVYRNILTPYNVGSESGNHPE